MVYLEILIRYLLGTRADLTKDDLKGLVKKIEIIYPEGSEKIMTLAEQFREEGIEIGRETLIRTSVKLLTKKFGLLPEGLKEEISKLDISTLEVMIDGILDYKTLDDVKKYIQ